MRGIRVVTALHGDEPLPTLATASVGIPQVVANVKALALGVRYVERDMNAAFGTDGDSYEERRAREVLGKIGRNEKVLDLHTFSVESEPFAIIVDLEMLPLASSLGLERVVYMKHNIKAGHALINNRMGVSVEVGKHDDPDSFVRTVEIVKKLKEGPVKPGSVRVFEVYGRIEERGAFDNFVERDGIVPVLYGERAYDNLGFYGLKAREITGIIGEKRI